MTNLCYEQKMHDLQVSSTERMESSADQTHSETKQTNVRETAEWMDEQMDGRRDRQTDRDS